jgi:hypothetical protein
LDIQTPKEEIQKMIEVEGKMTEQGQLAIKTTLIKNNLDQLLFRFDLSISSELKIILVLQ